MENKDYKELQDRFQELETQYLIEKEAHRKTKNHLMTIINSRSFRLGKTMLYVPHHGLQTIKGDKNKLKRALKKIYKQKTKGKIKIGIITRDGTVRPTSSAFLRLISPLTYGRLGDEVTIILLPDNTKISTEDIDVCIVQRTAVDNLGSARTLVKDLRDNGVRLIIDTDDNFGGLDTGHPQHSVHAEAVEALNYLKENADRIWVSTDELALNYKPKRVLMPNSFDNRLWGLQDRRILENETIKVVYMGTGTHDKDFEMIFPALKKINEKYDNKIDLTVIGVASKKLSSEDWLHFRPTNIMYPYFVKWFQKQGPFDIGLAPLENTDFNKAKSDIKVIDYLSIGVLPIVSDLKPYQNKDINDFIVKVGYSENSWFEIFEELLKDKQKYSNIKSANHQKIKKYLDGPRSVEFLSNKMLDDINVLLKSQSHEK